MEPDYQKLAELYKEFFPTHNIFQKDNVIDYLKEQAEKDQLLTNENAALFLVNLQSGEHQRWKFRHFAFTDETAAKDLLEQAENLIKEKSKTAKVELTIAESEQKINFYKNNGYQEEGKLTNHYRWGETCFVLGKSFK